jgi:molybdopterin converting factor small subunit
MIRVLFFGPVAESVSTRQMQIDFQPGFCLQDVVSQLTARYPKAFEIICFIAVNDVQTRDMRLALQDNDEIAFMAKYSGG